jgi:hypothetical protein
MSFSIKSPQGPGPWFSDVWAVVDLDRRRAMARKRAQRLRARRRSGSVPIPIEVSRDVIDFLIDAGRLGQWDENHAKAITAAVEILLTDLVANADEA